MATNKPRFSVTFTEDAFARIQKYQKENSISTQSKAVAQLVSLAISEIDAESKIEKKTAPAEASTGDNNLKADEAQLVEDYRSLNDQGQEYIRQTMYMTKQTYKKMPDDSIVEKWA